MRLRARRWLFLIHRWLGIVTCAFFAMWFLSGMVMMYVGYPKLTQAERLQHLPALAAEDALLSPRQALDAAGMHGALKELRLAVASGGRPVYIAMPAGPSPGVDGGAGSRRDTAAKGRRQTAAGSGTVVIDARTGATLERVDRQLALDSAAAYAGHAAGLTYLGTIDEDAFTHSRALDAHRPLHRVLLDDTDATLLYVSGRSGEVVRDATRSERLWNYAGAWLHWLYPLRGNAFDRYWADIVNGLSIIGIAVALTGTVVGLLRWRFSRRYRNGSRSPYPSRLMRWHHISGLLFAMVTFTWIFSGLMSMNPWRVFDSGAPALRTEALQGGPLEISSHDVAPAALLAAAGGAVRELRWVRILGATAVLAQGAAGRPVLFDSRTVQALLVDENALRLAASRLLPAPIARIERLLAYDLYYYAREAHTMTGGADKPLPVLRVVFDDAHATWVHLDPHTAVVLGRTDSGRRLSRWLFAMLHSWDWLPLLERRPLWDIMLIALSLGGTALSLTGIVIGWRRLGLKLRATLRGRPTGARVPLGQAAPVNPIKPAPRIGAPPIADLPEAAHRTGGHTRG